MARTEIERSVRQPLLDRLTDDAPGLGDPPSSWAESVRQFKASVRRDLEWLLNTRRIPEPVPEGLVELRRSLYAYGLPDITSLSRDSASDRTLLLRQVAEAIGVFEPRLGNVKVSLVETDGAGHRRELRFLIEGVLRLDPNPEHVVFDTVLELSSGEYDVTGAGGA
ncbi:MAG TPA: type VI secretion system baseplate subunit TssE [Gemmatimonadaceae bacterium]|nr:type VI secretion system baseplate subunit TssE [Gemmatimonadaceae bacterium]